MASAEALEIGPGLTIPAEELETRTSRSSGPGGQHVNTADTRVQLRWNPGDSAALDDAQKARVTAKLAPRLTRDGDLVIACDTHRSQRRNREEARDRLAALVRSALVRPRTRRRTRVPRSSREKRLQSKQRRSQVKRQRRRPEDD